MASSRPGTKAGITLRAPDDSPPRLHQTAHRLSGGLFGRAANATALAARAGAWYNPIKRGR